jgi:hypothetical protein
MLPSRDEAKGIVVEAIQLLLPDAVFTLEDEQNVTNQAPGFTHTQLPQITAFKGFPLPLDRRLRFKILKEDFFLFSF